MKLAMNKQTGTAMRRSGMADAVQYRVIYAICFTVFLIAASIERLMQWTGFTHRPATKRSSILEQAGEAAGTCTTYAFMS